MADRPFEASPSRGTVRPMLERMGRTLTERKQRANFYQLLSSAFVSSEDRGGCYRWITPSEISIILQMIRKPNSIIVL